MPIPKGYKFKSVIRDKRIQMRMTAAQHELMGLVMEHTGEGKTDLILRLIMEEARYCNLGGTVLYREVEKALAEEEGTGPNKAGVGRNR